MIASLAMIDTEAALDTKIKHVPKKESSLRKWGPSMVVIFGVIAINGYLLGPTGGNIPPLSDRQVRSRELAAERTSLILDMEFDHAEDVKIMGSGLRSFGSRNLSEENGGIMEYTRRRHRHLGEYVHVDVSGDFSSFGKWSIAIIYFAFWVFLMVRTQKKYLC